MCTGSHKSFSDAWHPMGRKILKRILTYLSSIKYNEINIDHLDAQNHISHKNNIHSINILYTSSYKRIPIYYGQ